MLKIRLQGTLKDIQVSDAYANKGTSKYFRVYVEVEEKE